MPTHASSGLFVPRQVQLKKTLNDVTGRRPSPPSPPPSPPETELQPRPYQVELLEKAKKNNIIVYLGTGSGKTFIAVMLIKHMRDLLALNKKVVFLANSVALLDQQTEVISKLTGLTVGSYSGVHGVDDWDRARWETEKERNQVMVFIHQVFLNSLSSGHFKISDLALLIIDECHHSVKGHPYCEIMKNWYHKAKKEGEVPKVLGLSASIVVKSVKKEEFQKEKALLESVLDAKVETCEGISLETFVNFASESVLFYPSSQGGTSTVSSFVSGLVVSAKLKLFKVKSDGLKAIGTMKNKNNVATATESLNKDFKFFSNVIIGSTESLLEMGLYPLVAMEESLYKELRSKCRRTTSLFHDKSLRDAMEEVAKDCLDKIFQETKRVYNSYQGSEKDKILFFTSAKVLRLAETLEKKAGLQVSPQEMRCIVFVEKKLTATALKLILSKLEIASILEVGHVYSCNSNKNVKDASERKEIVSEKKIMNQKLKKFRSGEINVLVSTSVVEEGIDVPSCNLVIKFDFPQSFRSYIQSKGRARKKDSKYILMVEDRNTSNLSQYQEWKDVYEMSIRECHNTYNDTILPINDLEIEEEEGFSTSVARVSGNQALRLLHKYLQRIPVDRFTKLSVAWTYQEQHESNQGRLWRALGLTPPVNSRGVIATVQLPHKTPLHLPVSSAPRPSKERAKRSAALKVVKLLHQIGEIGDDLRVTQKKRLVEEEEDQKEEEESRKYYKKTTPPILSDASSGDLYLHVIDMSLVKPLVNPRYRLHDPKEDSHFLGVLTPAELPTIGPLEVFGPSGLVQAFLSVSWEPLKLSSQQIFLAENFHRYVFSTVNSLTEYLQHCPSSLPLVVPVSGSGSVDWNLCQEVLASQHGRVGPPVTSLLHKYQDLVLYPVAGEEGGAGHYFVEEVSYMTASTVMKGLGMSLREHYKIRHQINIRQPDQPLLRVSSGSQELLMLHEGGERVADGKERTYRSYRLGELMGVEPLGAGLWRQCQMVPWVLHRVTSLLATLPFLHHHWREGQLSLHVTEELEETEQRRMERMKQMMIGADVVEQQTPTPGHMLQALTLLSARDHWNMERLEFLGDSFLKFSTTLFLYYKMRDTCDEGDLSLARSRIVGNRNLFQISRALELANCGIVSDSMNPLTNWTPPGYVSSPVLGTSQSLEEALVELETEKMGQVGSLCKRLRKEEVEEFLVGNLSKEDLVSLVRKRQRSEDRAEGVKIRGYNVLSDKSQADCVEAMMGSYLYHCGPGPCLQFMASIGIDLSSASNVRRVCKRTRSDQPFVSFTPKRDAFVNDKARAETESFNTMLNKLGVQEIEQIIGYTFREKSFLLEAFTHPSYEENRLTGSYEKLEFLGDAVLDYIVTCYIYSHTLADPGTLTDIRASLVCNNMFAGLTTDLKLDKFILHCNPNILSKITSYLEDKLLQEDSKPPQVIAERTMMQFNEEDVPQLEMVEVPKVLGDIFESVIGAIFLDSGHNLEVVWNIYRRLCPNLEAIVENPPQNTKKKLLEMYPGEENVKFSRAKSVDDCIIMEVEVVTRDGVKRFQGRGRSKTVATLAACKCALRCLNCSSEKIGFKNVVIKRLSGV